MPLTGRAAVYNGIRQGEEYATDKFSKLEGYYRKCKKKLQKMCKRRKKLIGLEKTIMQ